jgi:hypothetical protein
MAGAHTVEAEKGNLWRKASMTLLDTPREYARPVEEVARAIWEAHGWHAPDDEDKRTLPWTMCIRQANAAIDTLRKHGFISDLGITAIEAERMEK